MATGFVKKRGGVWYAYFRTEDGRQRCKAVSSRKKDAERYLVERQAEVNAGTFRELKPATFREFAERWLSDYAALQVKPSTLTVYEGIVKRSLIPAFGDRPIASIGTDDVQRYVSDLAKRPARKRTAKKDEPKKPPKLTQPATIKKHLMVLKNMLNQAVLWGYLKHNPALPVKSPRIEHKEMRFLTPAEIPTFLAHVDDWHRPLFMTAIFTGMRLGELIGLKWSDIDWGKRVICVQRSVWEGEFQSPKTASSVRNVGMSPMLADVLLAHKVQAPYNEHDLVFTTPDGCMVDPDNLRNRVFADALKNAKLPHMRIHDLRHTFATLLINQGENIKYVQQQLGHSSIQVTVDRYGHLMPDVHVGASERLDAFVFGSGSLDDKLLTSTPETEQAESPISPRPAVLLVGDEGFEPPTVTL